MRKVLVALFMAALLTGGAAFAQGTMAQSTQWVGGSFGYPFGVTLHYGMNNMVSNNIDLRLNTSVLFVGALGLGVGADALYNIPIENAPVTPYVGGGPAFDAYFYPGGMAFDVGARLVGGAEYRFQEQYGVFAEVHLGAGYFVIPGLGGGFAFLPGGELGFNYHF